MAMPAFVGREPELVKLQTRLAQAQTGQGQIAFICGEAGSGKTALLQEFARRSQVNHSLLVIAIGNCNAYTGIGDPYLPFREILSLLTGESEAKLAEGVISTENADRLRSLTARSMQILVEVGPDLINTFIPGSLILGKIGQFVAKKTGWMEKLDKVTRVQQQRAQVAESPAEQSRLFEQYTNFLIELAHEHPLLLVVDDLQWADAASASLLFHLSRRIGAAPILLLGAYRPDEVGLGRGDQRHPLDKVLVECKRYYGEIIQDLRLAMEAEGPHFVDALLATQANQLDTRFRLALFAHTEGHPLFTVELLRTLQERGDLARDEYGRWVAQPGLDWTTLPPRVEGVIEERVGHLEEELRQLLTIASVEGEDFTAQVIATVQDLSDLKVVQTLSQELEKRHHLVREQGEFQVGRRHLSRYRFAHSLFQSYLYRQLGSAERRLLHGEVARALEALYAGEKEAITVQLAHHYDEAQEDEKAIEYLFAAGKRARRLYANQEAIDLLRRALVLLESIPGDPTRQAWQQEMACQLNESLGDLLFVGGQAAAAEETFRRAAAAVAPSDPLAQARLQRKIGDCRTLQRQFENASQAYLAAEAALGPDQPQSATAWWSEWFDLQVAQMMSYYWQGRDQDILAVVEKARPFAEQHGTVAQRAAFFKALTLMNIRRDRYLVGDATLDTMRAYLAAQQELDNPGELAFATFLDAFCWLWYGDLDQAEAQMQTALALAERTGDIVIQARCLTYLAITHRKRGALEPARRLAARQLEVVTAANMPEYIAQAKASQAWLAWRAGQMAAAESAAQAALELWRPLLGSSKSFQWTALWLLIAVELASDRFTDAVEHARLLVDPSQQRLPIALAASLDQTLQAWDKGESDLARSHLQQAFDEAQAHGYL